MRATVIFNYGLDVLHTDIMSTLMGQWTEDYLAGHHNPHFQLPAIHLRPSIFGDMVVIWNRHTGRAVEVYLKE